MPDETERRNLEVSYEEHDIRAFAVTGTGLVVLFGTLLTVFVMWFFFDLLKKTRPEPAPRAELAPEYSLLRQPVLQVQPRGDLASLRAYEDRILNGYTWADQQRRTVILPIERAMDEVVKRGIPPAGDVSGLNLFPPRTGTRSTGFDRLPDRREEP
jgi:hypothetical protein